MLHYPWRLGHLDGDDYHRAVDLQTVRGETLPAGREVTTGELSALFRVCSDDSTPAGSRDAALLSVMYAAGLRRSEVVALDVADYTPDTGALIVKSGKGNKSRISYTTNAARSAVEDWISTRGDEPGALFCPVRRGGKVVLRRLSDQALLRMLNKRRKQAGVAACSPHDLRRSMISHLLEAGCDVSTVQRLAGHSNVATTVRYDRRGERAKQRGAELLHVPYEGRDS